MNDDLPIEFTEENALAAFYVACAVAAALGAVKAHKAYKTHKKNKKLREIHPDVDTAQEMLNMKAIYQEWNVN